VTDRGALKGGEIQGPERRYRGRPQGEGSAALKPKKQGGGKKKKYGLIRKGEKKLERKTQKGEKGFPTCVWGLGRKNATTSEGGTGVIQQAAKRVRRKRNGQHGVGLARVELGGGQNVSGAASEHSENLEK